MRRSRNFGQRLPAYLPRATEFTDDPVLGNPDWVVQTLLAHRSQLPLIDTLIERTTVSRHEGRRRLGDKAALLARAYVAPKKPSMEQFWKDYGQNKFWELVGFARDDSRDEGFEHRPSYRTFYNRITELELDTFIRAFDDAADELVKIAIENEPRIVQDVIVDSTRYATPSRSYQLLLEGQVPGEEAKRQANGRAALRRPGRR